MLNYLEGMIKRFWGGYDVCAISSSRSATLGGGGEEIVSGVVCATTATSDGFVAPRETSASNGGMLLL